jgi:hypothetical protein
MAVPYLLSKVRDSWLGERVEAIRKAPDGAQRWLRDLGKNGYSHAEAVAEYASKLLEESRVAVSPEEAYLLLHAIYVHDVGYRVDPATHPEHSRAMVLETPGEFFILDAPLAEAIGWLCAAHGMNDLTDVPQAFPVDLLSRTEEFDLQFLSAVLLLADEMDQTYLRVFNVKGQKDSPRTEVYHVEIGPQIIKLKTKPSTEGQYKELKDLSVKVQLRLQGVHAILRSRGVKIEEVRLYPLVWTSHQTGASETIAAEAVDGGLLFILDRTVFGMQMQQEFRPNGSRVVVPIAGDQAGLDKALEQKYESIVLVLGEDFNDPASRGLLEAVSRNTDQGGGLVLFPFVAWSVAQGLNDAIEELLPVAFMGEWREGAKQAICDFAPHPISKGVRPFTIENTYEVLAPIANCQSVVADEAGVPVVAIREVGRGRVAYVNFSSHQCRQGRAMTSPWLASSDLRILVSNTIDWTAKR